MPRTIQEILDELDELADKYENFDPDHGQERPIEAARLCWSDVGGHEPDRVFVWLDGQS